MTRNNVNWAVGLSNGLSLQEGRGDYEVVQGELSPYNRLLTFIEKNNLKITSLSLLCGDRRWILPSAGKNPKFKIFGEVPQPISYKFFRKLGVDLDFKTGRKEEHYSVIEAQYEHYKLQVWVNEDTLASWSIII
jgi:hypothetical protein